MLSRIVRDEALHGSFGWSYLEWASELLTAQDRVHLSLLAARSIYGVLRTWDGLKRDMALTGGKPKAHSLGWMQTRNYLTLAARSLRRNVLEPLARHGIDPEPYLGGELEDLAPPAGAAPHAAPLA